MRELSHPRVGEITLTGVLAALSDPVRLQIVSALAGAKREVGWGEFEVCGGKATLSHHMKTLRLAGLINHRQEGTRCFVSLRGDLESVFPGLLKSVLRAASRPPAGAQ